MAHHDPIVRNARHNLGVWVALLAVAVASAVAIGLSLDSQNKSEETARQIRAAGPPCVDTAPGPAVRPSRGCRRFFVAISNLCAKDPEFCRRSQQRAAKRASTQATSQQLAAAQGGTAIGGGGGSKGNNPNSPTTPPPEQGGGGDNADGGDQQPDPVSTSPDPVVEQLPVVPQPETPTTPLIELPEQACEVIDPLVDSSVRLCP